MTYIYALIDPRNECVRYIGKTNNPKYREYQHLHRVDGCHHKVNWIKSLLKENLKPEFFILDLVDDSEWQFWEGHYIHLYKSFGFYLTNASNGGESPVYGYKHSDEAKMKLSNFFKGRKLTDEHKKKISESGKGKQIGKILSEETIEKIKIARSKQIITEEQKQRKREKYITDKKQCPNCKRLFDFRNYAQYHGDKCKYGERKCLFCGGLINNTRHTFCSKHCARKYEHCEPQLNNL